MIFIGTAYLYLLLFFAGIVASNINDLKIAGKIILGVLIIIFVITFRFKDKGLKK